MNTIEYAKSNSLSGIILLCDFEKAFDSPQHSFILKTINYFNFGHDFIKWTNTLLNNFFSVINDDGNISERYPSA